MAPTQRSSSSPNDPEKGEDASAHISLHAPRHILVLGAGFGGVYAAGRLVRRLKGVSAVRVTLVDRNDFFLYTPLLPSLATGALEVRHVAHPLRDIFAQTPIDILVEDVEDVDFARRVVRTSRRTLAFDDLVIALGSETDFHGEKASLGGVLTLKTLSDAITIHDHIVRRLGEASKQNDDRARKSDLTFAIVGGGATGIEIAGEIHEFATSACLRPFGGRIQKGDIRVVLLEHHSRILKTLPEDRSRDAAERLSGIGIEILKDAAPVSYDRNVLRLEDGREIPTRTVIWTAGIRTSPLVSGFPLDKDGWGRIRVGSTLESDRVPGVWVIGDDSSCPDPRTGEPYPPTAQTAVHQAAIAADNIASRIRGEGQKVFSYQTQGMFVPIGDNYALFSSRKFTLKGRLAWYFWNLVHIAKLPLWHCRVLLVSGLLHKALKGRSLAPLDRTSEESASGH
jgi:NADH dehydrogenase